ncbi:hypothetical protein DL93DRAFT_2169871 [Clavulina sp. PMI_390]|nr:hypothetical protein DL93DRAFT_2169871 [Clavulina sp. PMI_390]
MQGSSASERDSARANSLLSLLGGGRDHHHQHQQQQPSSVSSASSTGSTSTVYQQQPIEPNIYPISTPQPYPPTGAFSSAGAMSDNNPQEAPPPPPVPTTTNTMRGSITVDSLFRGLSMPGSFSGSSSQQQQQQQPQQQQQQPYHQQQQQQAPSQGSSSDWSHVEAPSSAPPVPTVTSTQAAAGTQQQQPANQSAERQNALLSLLGNVGSPASELTGMSFEQRSQGSSKGTNEAQSRQLLETLLPGASQASGQSQSNYGQQQQQQQQQQQPYYPQPPSSSLDSYRSNSSSPGHTQPYSYAQGPQPSQGQGQGQTGGGPNHSPQSQSQQPRPIPMQPQSQQQPQIPVSIETATSSGSVSGAEQVMDPSRMSKPPILSSRFEYYSPFDALSTMGSSGTGSGSGNLQASVPASAPQPTVTSSLGAPAPSNVLPMSPASIPMPTSDIGSGPESSPSMGMVGRRKGSTEASGVVVGGSPVSVTSLPPQSSAAGPPALGPSPSSSPNISTGANDAQGEGGVALHTLPPPSTSTTMTTSTSTGKKFGMGGGGPASYRPTSPRIAELQHEAAQFARYAGPSSSSSSSNNNAPSANTYGNTTASNTNTVQFPGSTQSSSSNYGPYGQPYYSGGSSNIVPQSMTFPSVAPPAYSSGDRDYQYHTAGPTENFGAPTVTGTSPHHQPQPQFEPETQQAQAQVPPATPPAAATGPAPGSRNQSDSEPLLPQPQQQQNVVSAALATASGDSDVAETGSAIRHREDVKPVVTSAGAGTHSSASERVPPPKPMRGSPAIPNAPTYQLDMTASLPAIAAAPGLSAVTPIALLKLENVYSSGTTIAVSSFIAYAMTRGRVRLIARSNGSRSLLHLPQSFGGTTSVTDMVVSSPGTGSFLACVTNDGGLVVWDVPAELDENPPVPVVLHVAPPAEAPFALRLVKWHPRQLTAGASENNANSGTIAVASDREVYVFNVLEAYERFGGEEISLSALATISNVISAPSPLVGFTFDFKDNTSGTTSGTSLATLSIDSTIMLWDIKLRSAFWTGRVPGEGLPSSIDFVDGGLLVGRKQGTVLQLLPVMSASVAATVKLVTPGTTKTAGGASVTDEDSVFAHVGYDPRIKTVWVAHSSKPSLFAVRLALEPPSFSTSNGTVTTTAGVPSIDQIIEFPIPMQCINMAILVSPSPTESASLPVTPSDPTNPHANPLTGGSLATGHSNINNTTPYGPDLVGGGDGYVDALGNPLMAVASFAMHQGGVDQINIQMDTFEDALASVAAKLPPALNAAEPAGNAAAAANPNAGGAKRGAANSGPKDAASDGEAQVERAGDAAPSSGKRTGGGKSEKNAPAIAAGGTASSSSSAVKASPVPAPATTASNSTNPKDKSAPNAKAASGPAKAVVDVKVEEPSAPAPANTTNSPNANGVGLKDLRRVEDNLSSRISKLLTKELERQQQRLEDVRRSDQEADFARQEQILKLISSELTKNTTRVVEQAIKTEVQHTVLPALEAITKNEIKTTLGNQVSKGIPDILKTSLPAELERLLLRPEIGVQIARNFSTSVTPLVERQIKDSFQKNLIPAFEAATQSLQMSFGRDMSAELMNLRKEIFGWQSDTIRNTEASRG